MKERFIEHRGIVEQVMSRMVVVSIIQETACASCAAATLCRSSEVKEKTIEVPCADASEYQVGQTVTLVGDVILGLRATLWAYIVPLVLLVTILMIATQRTGSEGWGAILSLASLVPYYILLYILRGKLQRRFTFRIKKL